MQIEISEHFTGKNKEIEKPIYPTKKIKIFGDTDCFALRAVIFNLF